jgi:ankyrin repeat protein
LEFFLLDHGADVNLANKGGWTPLYLATDNRNIESGDYPVRRPDMDHLEYIKVLLNKGANVNARVKDSTETRTVFTNQWLDENGATAFSSRIAVGRCRADEVAAVARRGSEDCDSTQRDGAAGCCRHWLGRGNYVRMVAGGNVSKP